MADTIPMTRPDERRLDHFKLIILVLINIGALGLQGLLSPLTRELQTSFGIGLSTVSLMQAGFLIVYALATPVWALAAGRFTRRRLLIASSVLWGGCCALVTLFDSATAFTAGFWLASIGNAAVIPLTYSMAVDIAPPKQRGYAFGLLATGQTLSMGLAFLTGGFMAESFGWQGPFLVFAVFAMICAMYLIALLREEPEHGAMEDELQSLFESGQSYDYTIRPGELKSLVRPPANLLLVLATMLTSVADGGLAFWFIAMLRDEHGFSAADATLLTLVLFISQVPGSVVLAWASDRIQARWQRGKLIMLGVFTLAMAPCYFLALQIPWTVASLSSASFLSFLSLMIVGGFVTAALPPLLFNAVNDINPPERRSLLFSILSIARLSGRAIGIELVSLIGVAWFGSRISPGIAWAALGFIPAALCLLPVAKSALRDRQSLSAHLESAATSSRHRKAG